MTTLGTGEALVTVLGESGVPSAPVATRLVPPASRMGPLTDSELAQRLAASKQVQEYAQAIDRESAREMLAARMAGRADDAADEKPAPRRAGPSAPSAFEEVLRSPLTRSIATTVTRGLLGALLGPPPRRRRRYF